MLLSSLIGSATAGGSINAVAVYTYESTTGYWVREYIHGGENNDKSWSDYWDSSKGIGIYSQGFYKVEMVFSGGDYHRFGTGSSIIAQSGLAGTSGGSVEGYFYTTTDYNNFYYSSNSTSTTAPLVKIFIYKLSKLPATNDYSTAYGSKSFNTGNHTFVVPQGITQMSVMAVGAGGYADLNNDFSGDGFTGDNYGPLKRYASQTIAGAGEGGYTVYSNSFPVTPGETLSIVVDGQKTSLLRGSNIIVSASAGRSYKNLVANTPVQNIINSGAGATIAPSISPSTHQIFLAGNSATPARSGQGNTGILVSSSYVNGTHGGAFTYNITMGTGQVCYPGAGKSLFSNKNASNNTGGGVIILGDGLGGGGGFKYLGGTTTVTVGWFAYLGHPFWTSFSEFLSPPGPGGLRLLWGYDARGKTLQFPSACPDSTGFPSVLASNFT